MKKIELLAPARDLETARQAILHGADAVYIGPPDHGARKSAANSLDDLRRLVEFAHPFRAKVYATVNTIVYEKELMAVEKLITDLYRIGIDALIVQDMGILRLDIPPIQLHASTQCDNRTVEKARFLQDVGFSQIVLARELTLKEIEKICSAVQIPVEVFIHGALCVSYSGRCHASQAVCGRSANRGECSQICRLPYSLLDAKGNCLVSNRHLLSLKDLNASAVIADLLAAGVSSFKIEGRLKDTAYVKNITAYYRKLIDGIISANPEKYRRSSCGTSDINFTPDVSKSFNRSFTHYFLDSRVPSESIFSPLTPKSMGETVTTLSDLNCGDGISWLGSDGKFKGASVNAVTPSYILTSDGEKISRGRILHRNADLQFNKLLSRESAQRKIGLEISIDSTGVSARDERGIACRIPMPESQPARTPQDPTAPFRKLGNTIYRLDKIESSFPADRFIPASMLTAVRRELIAALDAAAEASYPFEYRRPEKMDVQFPTESLDYRDNVSNSKAEEFYKQHGVRSIQPAIEVSGNKRENNPIVVMTTRHCILRELGCCLKGKNYSSPSAPNRKLNPEELALSKLKLSISPDKLNFPLTLRSDKLSFRLNFDCRRCEMSLINCSERDKS